MELKLYNTLTRTKEVFRPLDPARVRMYVCGPTVYDRAHIGNARPVIVFDVLFRLLRHLYGADHVTYVRNITDVDDKINARAAERGVPIRELTDETYKWFKEDVAALGCLPPTHEPRATEYIEPMIKMIEALIATGHAYPAEGHVLFDVSSKPDYGKLSNRSVDDMIAGARVEVAPYKKNPMDFVLWKPSTPELPGWDSPWGRGRPGWHIECSAMGEALLGPTFDIHGGGIDLVFPHHENEVAQSECVHGGAPLAKIWMHNGFVQMAGEKMAKSEGNVIAIHELLAAYPADVIRLQMLMTHYRQPIDWTRSKTLEASQIVDEWFAAALRSKPDQTKAQPDNELVAILTDDLNTPEAITYLHKLATSAQKNDKDSQRFTNNVVFLGVFRDFSREIEPLLKAVDMQFLSEVLRLGVQDWLRRPNAKIESYKYVVDNPEVLKHYNRKKPIFPIFDLPEVKRINLAIENRLDARKKKDFAEADRIRDELAKMGVVLHDSKDSTTWEVAR